MTTMTTTKEWNDQQLQELFDACKRKYCHSIFDEWTAVRRYYKYSQWDLDVDGGRIIIDPSHHANDAEIEESLLRAMVEVVTREEWPMDRFGAYWREMDRLVRLGARFRLSPETFVDCQCEKRAWVLDECPHLRAAVDVSKSMHTGVA